MPKPLSIHRIWLGREPELAELDAGLRALLAGRGTLFLVTGEPGIGKTRLADELTRVAVLRGATVHWGRAWEAGSAPSYWIFTQVLRSVCQGLDASALGEAVGRHGPELAGLLPELRRQLPGLAVAPSQGNERFQLFEAVEAFLQAAATRVARLVVLDDLHAADPSSLQLLEFLVRGLRSRPLMLVCTYREAEARLASELAPTLRRLAREACVLPLRRLERAEVADFVAQASGTTPSAERVETVHRLTEGIPLFVRELLQLKGASAQQPDGVREVIRTRLSLLTPLSRGALSAAAVLGREFEVEPLAALAETSELDARASLEPAAHAGIVEPLDSPPRWRFTHVLLREELYESLPMERRIQLHRAAADVLLRRDGEPALSQIAHHLFHAIPAVSVGQAAHAAQRAAERAMDLLAFEDAIALFSRSCKVLLSASGEERRLGEALLGLGLAYIRVADVERGKDVCRRAAELARQLGDGALYARAVLTSAYEFAPWVRNGDLVSRLEEALAMLPPGDGALRARCMAQLAAERQPEPDTQPLLSLAREAVAMARRVGDGEALRATLSSAGLAMFVFADPQERLSLDQEALRLALSAGDLRLALRAHMLVGADLAELGDWRGALAHHRAIEEMFPQSLHDRFGWLQVGQRALIAVADGQFDVAERLLRETAERLHEDEARGGAMAAAPVAFCRASERYDDLPAVESRVRAAFGRMKHELGGCVGEMLLAQLYGRVGDRRRAASQLATVQAHPLFVAIKEASWLALLAEPCHLVGDVALAERLYTALKPRAHRFFNLGPLALGCEPPYSHPLGLLAQTLGRLDDAVAHLTDAEAKVAEAGMRGHLARLRYELAAALLLRAHAGDRELAAALLVKAHALAKELGQVGLLPLISARATEAGAAPSDEPRRDGAAPPFSLVREGDYWTIVSGDRTLRLRDSRGLHVLARLLASPGEELHVFQLVSAEGEVADHSDAGAVLDEAAVQSYRRRVFELRAELEEAEGYADLARAERARTELDMLTNELARAVGLGGRARHTGSAAERARTSVQKRLRGAIRRITAGLPEFGRHLERTIRTGTFCGYLPNGRSPSRGH